MKLHQLVVATHTPFHADGSLAPEVVATQAAFLAANGLKTVFITEGNITFKIIRIVIIKRTVLITIWFGVFSRFFKTIRMLGYIIIF